MSQASDASTQWTEATLAYAQHINDYVARGDACGWKGMGDPNQPPDLSALLPELLSQLRAANAEGSDAAIAEVRKQWPPLYEALQPLLESNGQGIGALAWLPSGELLVRTGMWYESGHSVLIRDLQVTDLPGMEMFGISPNQQVAGFAGYGQVTLIQTADQSPIRGFDLPDGSEELPPGYPLPSHDDDSENKGDKAQEGLVSPVQQLIPFDDASAVVVVQSTGVFLVSESHTKRLLPLASELTEAMEKGEPYPVRIDMCHAAVSPDGRLIACGEQDGRHRIFNAQGELIDSIGPHGEYPHHAAFFADGQHVALNACHFYNGGTIAVDVNALGSIDTDFYEEHPAVQVIDSSARVYASAPVGDSLALGDAHGYFWVRNPEGELQWKQHVGSTISAMAVSADGKMLAVGSYSGMVHIIDLTNTEAAPEQVGVRTRREVRRWLFWKTEERPLAW